MSFQLFLFNNYSFFFFYTEDKHFIYKHDEIQSESTKEEMGSGHHSSDTEARVVHANLASPWATRFPSLFV